MRYAVLVVALLAAGCSKKSTTIDIVPQPLEKRVASPERRYAARPRQETAGETIVIGATPTTVLFSFDSYTLSFAAKAGLDAWSGENRGKACVVIGGCCPIGAEQYNDQLGWKRAQAVGDYLVARGVLVADIQSYGEHSLVTDDPQDYHLNRRAEVRPQ